jgi:hypothetical protein
VGKSCGQLPVLQREGLAAEPALAAFAAFAAVFIVGGIIAQFGVRAKQQFLNAQLVLGLLDLKLAAPRQKL